MLGGEQEAWLFDGLAGSQARWNILAQQVMLMQHDRVAKSDVAGYSMDKWDGAVAARDRLLGFVQENSVPNLVVLTGDVHEHMAGELKADFNEPTSATLGHEFVATSITSSGDGMDKPEAWDKTMSKNPHMALLNDQRGYAICDVTPELWTTHHRVVDYVSEPDAAIKTRQSLGIESGKPGFVNT
jgi:alkaline phosphatase D